MIIKDFLRHWKGSLLWLMNQANMLSLKEPIKEDNLNNSIMKVSKV